MLIKDWYQIRHSLKRFFGIIFILSVIFGSSQDNISLLWIIEFLCFSSIITTFNLDERTKWDSYEQILAISVEKKIASKYVFMILCNIFGALLGGIISIVISPEDYLVTIGNAFFISILLIIIGTIMIPLLYKFGTEKMRVINIAIVLILLYSLGAITQRLINHNLLDVILIGLPIVGIISIFISIKISKLIYQCKEF